MPEITISTPDGDKTVVIAGETPTEEEKQSIINTFFSDQVTEKTTTEEETVPTREIDYDTGVQDMGFRVEFSKGDNDKEKFARLQNLGISRDAIEIDPNGEFILDRDKLPQQIKDKYGITGTGLLAIDEKRGFTKYDFADFYGEARGPLIGGIGASIAASGVGLIPAAIIAGGGSVVGYLLDEWQESKEGLRRETDEELGDGIKREFLFGLTGEAGGRALSSLLGRLFKGSGAQNANEARTLARDIIQDGGKPTVRATNESAILGRLQAIYEGVFPNAKAARVNADFVAGRLASVIKGAKLRKAEGVEGAIQAPDKEKILELIQRDITNIYGSADDLVKEANRNLDNMVQTEIDNIIAKFGDPNFDNMQIAKGVDIAKRIFDEDSNRLYGKAYELLGEANGKVDLNPLVQTLNKLDRENPILKLKGTSFGKYIMQNARTPITIQQLNSIRQTLKHSALDPNLIGTTDQGVLKALLTSTEQSLLKSMEKVAEKINRGGVDEATQTLKKGYDQLLKAQQHYSDGVQKFKLLQSERLYADLKTNNLDIERVFDFEGGIITPNRPDTLTKFLDTITPDTTFGIVRPPASFEEFITKQGFDPNTITRLPDTDAFKSSLRRKFEETTNFAREVAGARSAGVQRREAVRGALARGYLERITSMNKDVFGLPNVTGIAEQINQLGKTGKVLFGDDYNAVMNSLKDIASSGKRITERELSTIQGLPIADQVEAVARMTNTQKKLLKDVDLQRLSRFAQEGDYDRIIDTIFQRNGAAAIKKLQGQLGEDTMDEVRQAAMERILSQVGSPDMTAKEFSDGILTGQFSDKLNRILTSYGDETIDTMFGEAGPTLRKLVKESYLVSNKPIKGLGGLAAPTLVGGLSAAAFLSGPMAALQLAAGLTIMSKGLRSNAYLKLISRPRGVRPGTGVDYDKLGRAFEFMYETGGLAGAQQLDTEDKQRDQAQQRTPTVQPPKPKEDQSTLGLGSLPNVDDLFKPRVIQPRTDRDLSVLIPNPTTRTLARG
jgi:hypothetical protein